MKILISINLINKKISSNHKKCIKIIKEQKIKMDFLKNELNDMEEEILLS